MTKPKAVALIQKAVSLPGAVVSKTALHIDPKATEKQLGEIGAALVSIEGSRSWWLGDYGVFLRDRKQAELLKEMKAIFLIGVCSRRRR